MRLNFSRTCSIISIIVITALFTIHVVNPPAATAAGSDTSWKPVEQAIGRSGTLQPDGVFKISMPRSDLNVTIGNVTVAPVLALGSWIAFKDMGNGSMMMGDLVLTVDEVNVVMQKLQQGGIEQTALHNHLLGETPRIMYMHIAGHGDPVVMAGVVHDALALTGTPLKVPAAAKPTNDSLDTYMLDTIIGVKGKYSGNVYQLGVPRAEKISDEGMEVPMSMGLATSINFQPLGDGKAAIAGDFVLTGNEVNPVIRALKENDINVTAVHNHMINEEPRLFFLHFWATDDTCKLANGLKAALDKTNSSRSG